MVYVHKNFAIIFCVKIAYNSINFEQNFVHVQYGSHVCSSIAVYGPHILQTAV